MPASIARPMAGSSTNNTIALVVSSTKPRRARRLPGRALHASEPASKQKANIVSSTRIGEAEKVDIGHGEISLHHRGVLPTGERQHGIEAGGHQRRLLAVVGQRNHTPASDVIRSEE